MYGRRPEQDFAAQFCFEGDRLVFRYKCRGAPVEVSEAERDRAIERYAIYSRRAIGATMALYMGLALVVSWLPKTGLPTGTLMIAGMCVAVVCGWMLLNWAWDAPTLNWRTRRRIGFRLGFFGAWVMRIEAFRVRDIALGWTWWAIMAWTHLAKGSREVDFEPLMTIVLWGSGALLAATTLIKWATVERRRLRERRLRLWSDDRE